MSRLTLALLVFAAACLSMMATPVSAYVWRCHTPNGDIWTDQPPQSGDCEEYDGVFNPKAAPPIQNATPPQTAPPAVAQVPIPAPLPPPAPPVYAYPYAYSYPYAYPYPYPMPYGYYPRSYFGGPRVFFGLPPLVFNFGGHGHRPHFRGGFRRH